MDPDESPVRSRQAVKNSPFNDAAPTVSGLRSVNRPKSIPLIAGPQIIPSQAPAPDQTGSQMQTQSQEQIQNSNSNQTQSQNQNQPRPQPQSQQQQQSQPQPLRNQYRLQSPPIRQPHPQILSQPAPPKIIDKRSSRMSLFNLFSAPKVEKSRGYTEMTLTTVVEPSRLAQAQVTPRSTQPSPAPARAPSVQTRPRPAGNSPKKAVQRGNSLRPNPAIRAAQTWDPPPLFQAYPQSIKYATLPYCNTSPEAIMRAQKHKRQLSQLQGKFESALDLTTAGMEQESGRTSRQNNRLSYSAANAPGQQAGWSKKVYVLVTSGYVLQYAAEGPSDRMPERILKLGKSSAAYASDLIPGRHWVLQIAQSTNAEGAVSNSRSLLSRLRMPTPAAKRNVSILLLVFENPDEMDRWLKAVRKTIALVNGITPDATPRPSQDGARVLKERAMGEEPSHRFQVKRDPERFARAPSRTSTISPLKPGNIETTMPPDSAHGQVSQAAEEPMRGRDPERRSSEAPSVGTVVSADQQALDQLREDARQSIVSSRTSQSVTPTLTTSRSSSPANSSPNSDAFPMPDLEPLSGSSNFKSYMSATTATYHPRQSIIVLPKVNERAPQPAALKVERSWKPKRHSTYNALTSQQTLETVRRPASSLSHRPDDDIQFVRPMMDFPRPPRDSNSPRRAIAVKPLQLSPVVADASDESARPPSIIGQLPTISPHLNKPRTRTSFRPVPIRVQSPHGNGNGDGSLPKRFSSLPITLPSTSTIAEDEASASTPPATTPTAENKRSSLRRVSFTAPPPIPERSKQRPAIMSISSSPSSNTSSYLSNKSSPQPSPPSTTATRVHHDHRLKRPTSLQVRSSPAPFLSNSREYPRARSVTPTPPSIQTQTTLSSMLQGALPPPSGMPPSVPLPGLPEGMRAEMGGEKGILV
ncbi:hypothetical protein K402DRAFT_8090 [Aulographum hederae CBS 113979]|uniref:PH domain-containing protein n=1 Tax=Aulographum hederae CBS 113979 TaxID=1176131 RepID=A0A6G1HHL3_9PEZI|nr:hypothetical protein K402DRAFT_8090 [Aulographum hederae CBS 113979]